jgi:uncharacterized protein (TIRG00374 family)
VSNTAARQHLLALCQALVGAGLLTYLFVAMDDRAAMLDGLRRIATHLPLLLLALALGFNCLLLCTLRWWLLLRAHALPISFPAALRDYLIGHFFNAFMLGSVGGDAVKAVLVAKPLPGRRAEAVSTILMDRISGLTALLMLASTMLLLRYRVFMQSRLAMLFLLGAVGMLLVLVVGWWLLKTDLLGRHPRVEQVMLSRAWLAPLVHLYRALRECLQHPGLLWQTLLLSMANHLSLVGSALALGLGLGIRTASGLAGEALNYLTLFPVINGIASLPLSPGGLGTRELTTRYMMGLPAFAVDEGLAVTLSLLLYAVMLFWSLVGGLLYMLRGRLS